MKGVRDLMEKGLLTLVRCDGCTLGYKDAESKLPTLEADRDHYIY